MLQLSTEQVQSVYAHAERTYPEECCGILLGHINAQFKRVIEVYPVSNAWGLEAEQTLAAVAVPPHNHGKGDRYWIHPRDLLMVQRYARHGQQQVIGIYHSHPDQAAVPSECDRILAWSEYSYLIVSVHQSQAQDLLSWKLNDHHQFEPEAVHVLPTISAV